MTDILHIVDIATTPDRLYDAVTTQTGLASWWTPDTKAAPKVGAVNEFGFGPGVALSYRVDELTPHSHVAWTCVEGPPEWIGTRFVFDIAPNGDSTILHFTHAGLPDGYAHWGIFNYQEAQNLRSLKQYLETGKGEPHGKPASKIGLD